jgi:hypothetical protein
MKFSVNGKSGIRRRREGVGPVATALLTCLVALSISSRALAAVYSETITLATPPSSTFAASAGGDGWAVALSSTQVFNVFHHNPSLNVSCHNQIDASLCWPTETRNVNDGASQFATSGHPGLYLESGKLYVYATRVANHQAGVVCIDTVAAATSSNPFCGFTPLSGSGEAEINASWNASTISDPMLVGTKLYAFNWDGNAPAGGGVQGTENRLLCFDTVTLGPCAGQPFAVNLGPGGNMEDVYPAPPTIALGNQLVLPFVTTGGTTGIACFDGSAQTACAGSFPLTTPAFVGSYGPPLPVVDGTGTLQGFCIPIGSSCYTLAGSPMAAPPGFISTLGDTTAWQGPGLTLGPRVYTANGNTNNEVECYDFSTNKACTGFPKAFSNLGYIYTVNRDPNRPACIWVNSDNGSQQIQNFDAYSGGACNGIRVLTAQFVVPQTQCNPVSYDSLQLDTPAPGTYTSGTVAFDDGAGNPLPIPTESLDGTGIVSLTGLSLNTATGLPQFLITLVGAPPSLGQVTLTLTWESNYDPTCVGPGGTVTKQATTVTTSLSGGGNTGATLSVSSGTAVTDSATLAGANASAATGKVLYNWYSDTACSVVVASAGTTITTPGVIPPSAPVTLAPGTYYPVVTYSGDAGNLASSSNCGDEVLQVTGSASPPSCALTAVIAGPPKQLQITVQDTGSGLASVVVSESNNASVSVPSFATGSTAALVVTATKVDQTMGAQVGLTITDVNGLVTVCDPIVPGEAPSDSHSSAAGSAGGCSVSRVGGQSGLASLFGALVGMALVRRRRQAQ